MTTARVEYRNHVPYGWIAIEFCDIRFFGDKATEFNIKWANIKYEKSRRQQSKIDALLVLKKNYETEKANAAKDLKHSKDWWRFWNNKYEQGLKCKIKELNQSIKEINLEIQSIQSDKYYEVFTLIRKAEKFLDDNKFVLKSSNSSGSVCITHTDIWELE